MCLSIPGKIIAVNGNTAIIDYGQEKREAKLFEDSFSVGDYVYVSNKIVVQKIPEKEALACLRLFQ